MQEVQFVEGDQVPNDHAALVENHLVHLEPSMIVE